MLKILTIFWLFLALLACHPAKQSTGSISPGTPVIRPDSTSLIQPMPASSAHTDAFLEDLLASQPANFSEILARRKELKVQVIYTRIDRKHHNQPVFTPFYFNVDTNAYYYPASTVKMPVALLSLEKLHDLGIAGLNATSPMLTGAGNGIQTEVLNDPTAPDGIPSIAQYIKKIFLVSDNDAFNRLYEFLGQETIQRKLAEKGYSSANIYHRLSIALTEAENRNTNPVRFTDSLGNLLYSQPAASSKLVYAKRYDPVGSAYLREGNLVKSPMDFSGKNRFGLEDMTSVLKAILFPESLPQSQRFRISAADYQFVRKYMSEFPGESSSPQYPAPGYWDTYCKFLYYGSDTSANTNARSFRIFNKVGDAYGFLTDIAYFADIESGVEFLLSATIYCNSDGILNDDKYDYDSIGYPFMKNLGQLIYEYEVKRERKVKADLSEFKMEYDKR